MSKPALLVMDVQGGTYPYIPVPSTFLSTLSSTITSARAAKIPVIYVIVSFRPGYPEIPTSNLLFAPVIKNNMVVEGSASTEIPPEIAPLEGDILVTKRRVSAFSGSDLGVVLRGLGADTLVLTGLVTSGVVLSTLTEAVDLDFKLVVLKDLCGDSDEEVHKVLLEKVFPSRADVVASGDWVARIKQ
jgi:nicotinamidase-related amidase